MAGRDKKLKVIKVGVGSDKDLLDSYSPFQVGKIPATSPKKPQDAFETFKPKQNDGLDYKISQTLVRMDCGDTKINIKQTTAEYTPIPVPAKKQIKRSHVGKVKLKYIDEIQRGKQEEMQKQHAVNFKKFVKNRKLFENQKANYFHNRIMSMVGPEWYQELSPNQLNLVTCLEYFLYQDYLDSSIINTQYAIDYLGLVPRPKEEHIWRAFELSLGNVVQFLLNLYQLKNPNRKFYSLNDRLLLSAVVHLTMVDTLYELHVRIPSPPERKETIEQPRRKSKIKTYKSPYLVPFSFKPTRTTPVDDFEKKHKQCAESPYFSYVEMLNRDMEHVGDIADEDMLNLSEVERGIFEETRRAQTVYNKLHNTEVNLMKPRYYSQLYIGNVCIEGPILPPLAKLEDTEISCECKLLEDQLNCCHENKIICDCDGPCTCKEKSLQFISYLCNKCRLKKQHKNACNIIGGVKLTQSNSIIPIIGGTFVERTCNCLTEFRDKLQAHYMISKIQCESVKYIIGSMTLSKIGPVYLITTALSNKRMKQLLEWQNNQQKRKCTCAKKNAKSEENENQDPDMSQTSSCICKEDEDVIPDFSPPTFGLDGQNENVGNGMGDTNQVNPFEEDDCKCKNELDIFLQHQCTCEKCNVERRRQEATYLMSGTMDIEDDDPITILAGVRECRCDCLRDYIEKLDKLQQYKKRVYARYKLRSQSKKYVIGGVCMTEEGPQYLLTGVREPVKCVCADMVEERQKAEEAQKHMAKMPDTGRITYAISGVRECADENTYILSHALPMEKCSCEKLYEAFVDLHQECMGYYDQFLATIDEEKLNYEEEKRMNPDYDDDEEEGGIFGPDIEFDPMSDDEEKIIPCDLFEPTHEYDEGTSGEKHYSMSKIETQPTTNHTTSEPTIKDNNCFCSGEDDTESERFDSSYAIKLTNSNDNNQNNLKRFVIMEKFTCQWTKWKPILEKVLSSMAEDGFPLAMIPGCHKLPHFKLWMYFRCGKCWTTKEIANMTEAHYLWNHTDKCKRVTRIPNLKISPSLANRLTWRNAAFVKNLISTKYQEFYRKLKRQRIDSAREFFPTTFANQFSNKNFRDCFFAYLPSKEDDIFVEALNVK